MEGGVLLQHKILWIFGYFSMGRAEQGQSTGWPANGFIASLKYILSLIQ